MKFQPAYRISVKAHVLGLFAIVAVTAVVIFADLHRTVLAESAIASAVVCAVLLVYYTALLYRGVRPDNGYVAWKTATRKVYDNIDAPSLDANSLPSLDLAGDDLFGALIGAVLALLVGILVVLVIAGLVWLGMNLVAITSIGIFIPLYYIFRRSLRLVLVHAARCRGDAVQSLMVASRYAVGYSAFLGLTLFGIDSMIRALAH